MWNFMKITKYYGNIWVWKCSNNEIWPHVKFLFAFEFNTSSKTMFLLFLNMYAEYTKYWQVFDLKWLSFNHCQECICEHVFSYKRYETTQDFQMGAQKYFLIMLPQYLWQKKNLTRDYWLTVLLGDILICKGNIS